MEAADAGLPLVVCITEGIPVNDMVRVRAYLQNETGHPSDRAQLPGRHHSRQMQNRHHAVAHS